MKIKKNGTNIIKEVATEVEASLYIGTGEWEVLDDKKSNKSKLEETKSL